MKLAHVIAVALAAAMTAARGSAQSIAEFPIPTRDSAPTGIVAGADGHVWFCGSEGDQLGRINPTTHQITEFRTVNVSAPQAVTLGMDGNVWFTSPGSNVVGRVTPSGEFREFFVTTLSSTPTGIAAGPDENLWFTEASGNKIARVTLTGVITEFALSNRPVRRPTGIAAGPDGNLWFTAPGANLIGRITTGGATTEFALPMANSQPQGISAGSDGNVWFTEFGAHRLGRVTPSGDITEIQLPAGTGPAGIATGPEGALWITAQTANKLLRLAPLTGEITEFPLSTPVAGLHGIAAGPDGKVWFTERDGNRLGVITPPATHDSTIRRLRPLSIRIAEGKTSVTRTINVKISNVDINVPEPTGHTIALNASDGDCPLGTVGTPDLDPNTPGFQTSAVVAAGRSKVALVPLTIARSTFHSFNARSPQRCSVQFSVTTIDPPQAFDPSPNNTAPLVLDVLDENDF
jgi:virginiamycin B lyase